MFSFHLINIVFSKWHNINSIIAIGQVQKNQKIISCPVLHVVNKATNTFLVCP